MTRGVETDYKRLDVAVIQDVYSLAAIRGAEDSQGIQRTVALVLPLECGSS